MIATIKSPLVSSVAVDPERLLLSILLLVFLLVLEHFIRSLESRRSESGLSKRSTAVSIDGGSTLPVRDYVSDIQGLAGRPDAVISENGFLIPVERKPLARKLRDRYVAQLLVYMRLIEEFEGKKPPYGYLILGSNCRKIRIENTPKRQAWLQKILDEMRDILAGQPATPTPHLSKCGKCDVRDFCDSRADVPRADDVPAAVHADLIRISRRNSPIQ